MTNQLPNRYYTHLLDQQLCSQVVTQLNSESVESLSLLQKLLDVVALRAVLRVIPTVTEREHFLDLYSLSFTDAELLDSTGSAQLVTPILQEQLERTLVGLL